MFQCALNQCGKLDFGTRELLRGVIWCMVAVVRTVLCLCLLPVAAVANSLVVSLSRAYFKIN